MKLTRLLGLVLIAVFALSALAASPASAIPRYRLPLTLRGFVGLSGLTRLRNRITGALVDCTHDRLSGTIVNDVQVDFREHWLNCTAIVPGRGTCPAQSVGSTPGLILSGLLRGLLGLLRAPAGAAAMLAEPASGHVLFTLAATEAPCETPETAFEGSVAGLYSPTGKVQNTAKLSFAIEAATDKQEITEILLLGGTVKPRLTGFEAGETTEESTEELTYEESVEVT